MLVGATVPDLRGMFLRGRGENAAAVGQSQIDTMRPIIARTGTVHIGRIPESPFLLDGMQNRPHAGPNTGMSNISFDTRLLGPHFDGPETRPVNVAVRYLIRAAK